MASQKAYDAGAKTAELVPTTFVVEEHTFDVKRSGKALRAIIGLTDPASADDPDKNIELMYKGIALVLVDRTRDPEVSEPDEKEVWHPKVDWLEDNVDFEVAQDFMEKILPQRGRDAVGNSNDQSGPNSEKNS